ERLAAALGPVLEYAEGVVQPDIDPKVDYAFKKLFGSEGALELLVDVLNAVLNPHLGQRLQEVALLNPFSDTSYAGNKVTILDVKARDFLGRQYHLEMQRSVPWSFDKRVVLYAATLHSQQMLAGDFYETLCTTFSICFLSENLFEGDEAYHHRFVLYDA